MTPRRVGLLDSGGGVAQTSKDVVARTCGAGRRSVTYPDFGTTRLQRPRAVVSPQVSRANFSPAIRVAAPYHHNVGALGQRLKSVSAQYREPAFTKAGALLANTRNAGLGNAPYATGKKYRTFAAAATPTTRVLLWRTTIGNDTGQTLSS